MSKFTNVASLMFEVEKLQMERDQLKYERDALAAQVELFNNVRKQFNNTAMSEYEALMAMFELCCSDASNLLAEIRAEAGRAGYQLGAGQWCFNQDEVQIDIERSAEEYADKIRQGGAK
jgi:hypothetical protein